MLTIIGCNHDTGRTRDAAICHACGTTNALIRLEAGIQARDEAPKSAVMLKVAEQLGLPIIDVRVSRG